MRSEDLYKAIGNIDDRYIDDRPIGEVAKSKTYSLWRTLVAVAACIALVLTVVTIWDRETTEIVYPTSDMQPTVAHSDAIMNAGPYLLNYADLAALSDIIVVADVVDTFQAVWDKKENVFLPYANVKVYKVLKGHIRRDESICVQDAAHIIDDKVYSFFCGPIIGSGNRVLLFLTMPDEDNSIANGKEYYRQALPWIGAFFYDQDGYYHPAAEYGSEEGDYSVKFTDTSPKPIQEIRRLIQKKHQSLSEEDFDVLCGFKEIYSVFFTCK